MDPPNGVMCFKKCYEWAVKYRGRVSVGAVGAAAPTVFKKSPFVPLKFEGLHPQIFQSHF